jgi:predicted amidophosphoribosyltransferase
MSDRIEAKEQGGESTCRCPFCQREMAKVLPFCASCGVALAECPSCGAPMAQNATQCPNCGAEGKN